MRTAQIHPGVLYSLNTMNNTGESPAYIIDRFSHYSRNPYADPSKIITPNDSGKGTHLLVLVPAEPNVILLADAATTFTAADYRRGDMVPGWKVALATPNQVSCTWEERLRLRERRREIFEEADAAYKARAVETERLRTALVGSGVEGTIGLTHTHVTLTHEQARSLLGVMV